MDFMIETKDSKKNRIKSARGAELNECVGIFISYFLIVHDITLTLIIYTITLTHDKFNPIIR